MPRRAAGFRSASSRSRSPPLGEAAAGIDSPRAINEWLQVSYVYPNDSQALQGIRIAPAFFNPTWPSWGAPACRWLAQEGSVMNPQSKKMLALLLGAVLMGSTGCGVEDGSSYQSGSPVGNAGTTVISPEDLSPQSPNEYTVLDLSRESPTYKLNGSPSQIDFSRFALRLPSGALFSLGGLLATLSEEERSTLRDAQAQSVIVTGTFDDAPTMNAMAVEATFVTIEIQIQREANGVVIRIRIARSP
ncbi:MAG TPA: hypothetical protein VE153_28960 [Myxococcus sp.]|nr:hypothetical protein [Myxococcus sp.]